MENIKKLNAKLKKLESITKDHKKISDMSVFDFIIYKHNIARKISVKQKLKKEIFLAKRTIDWYKQYTNSLINDFKITPSQYNILEKKAKYKRNKVLHRLGLIKQKPIHPYFVPVQKILNTILKPVSKFHFFCKKFKSYILPQKLNSIAVSAAKLCICGCRTIKLNYKFISQRVNLTPSAKYVHSIMEQAKKQLNPQKSYAPPIIVQTVNSNYVPFKAPSNIGTTQNRHIVRYECNR